MYCAATFGLIFAVAGLWLLVQSIKQYRASVESKNWPFVEGTITDTTLQVAGGRGGARYCPRVSYSYSVMGQPYASKQISIGSDWWTSSYEKAQVQLQEYPPGQPVVVYYNPQNPTEATLEPGTTRGAWATLFMGIAFTAVGMLTLALAIGLILR